MTHTPGPWIAKGYSIWGPKTKETKIGLVANTMSSYPAPECEANAHLIAAAPDLLEALQNCIGWLDRTGESMSEGGKEYDYVTMARKAVNKAERKG